MYRKEEQVNIVKMQESSKGGRNISLKKKDRSESVMKDGIKERENKKGRKEK